MEHSVTSVHTSRPSEPACGNNLRHDGPLLGRRGVVVKRCLDVTLSCLMLFVLSPILLAVALGIRLGSGAPVLYRQERIGLNFRPFHILKFRTMRVNKDAPSITIAGDRRITRIGTFLRRTKLDELPQFWNVLRGDMSLVGPRPEIPYYVDLFKDRYRTVLAIRPGITDVASIRFRNEEEILAKSREPLIAYVESILPAKLDLAEQYAKNHTIVGDLFILLLSVIAIFKRLLMLDH